MQRYLFKHKTVKMTVTRPPRLFDFAVILVLKRQMRAAGVCGGHNDEYRFPPFLSVICFWGRVGEGD